MAINQQSEFPRVLKGHRDNFTFGQECLLRSLPRDIFRGIGHVSAANKRPLPSDIYFFHQNEYEFHRFFF